MDIADVNRVLVLALYIPACLFVYWRLFPRLSPISKGLASFMLATQSLVIMTSIAHLSRNDYYGWLWNLNGEHNIPATLASAHLAMVGFTALLIAGLRRGSGAWQSIYFVGLGLLFIHLARDEFLLLHESDSNWQVRIVLVGAAVVMATALSAVRLPCHLRRWHLCIVVGLGVGGASAALVDVIQSSPICQESILSANDRCYSYVLEESLEVLGMWLALVGLLGHVSDATPRSRGIRLVCVLTALWIIAHHLPYLVRLAEYNSHDAPVTIQIEPDIELRIHRLRKDQHRVTLQLFALARSWHHYTGVGYSLHLVDQVTGASVAGVDASATRSQSVPYQIFGKRYLYKQWMEIDITSIIPRNRALWLLLTTWRESGEKFIRQKSASSDYSTLDEFQVVLDEMVIRSLSAASEKDALAQFNQGVQLEDAAVPSSIRAGDTLAMTFHWRSNRGMKADTTQFLHFGHNQTGEWWVYDQPPLGGRLPTRLWYSGMADSETWQVTLPANLAPGQYSLYTGLYRNSDLERLPASAADGTPYADNRIPLGNLNISTSG